MKKRLTMFALIVGLIVAFSANAWATTATKIIKGDPGSALDPIKQFVSLSSNNTIKFTVDVTDQAAYWSISDESTYSGTQVKTVTINGVLLTLSAETTKEATVTATQYAVDAEDIVFYIFASPTVASTAGVASDLTPENALVLEVTLKVQESTVSITTPTSLPSTAVKSTVDNKGNFKVEFDNTSKFDVDFTTTGTGAHGESSGVTTAWSISDGKADLEALVGTTTFSDSQGTGKLTTTAGAVTGTGTATFTVTVTKTINNRTFDASKTFTVEVTGTKPEISLAEYNGSAYSVVSTPDTDAPIGAIYDGVNKAYFVGKDVSKYADQTSTAGSQKLPAIRITTDGYAESTTVTATITGTGSGIEWNGAETIGSGTTAVTGSSTAWTANNSGNTKRGYVDYLLNGEAAKAGNYTLKITATNSTGTDTKSYKFTIKDVPTFDTIEESKLTVTWGQPFELKITPKNATTLAFKGAATQASEGVYVDNMGSIWSLPANSETTENAIASKTQMNLTISGTTATLKGTWAPDYTNTTATQPSAVGSQVIFNLIAHNGAAGTGTVYQVYTVTLNLVAGAPEIKTKTLSNLKYGTAVDKLEIASAKGAQYMAWDKDAINEALPLGLKVDETASTGSVQTADTLYLRITGTPMEITPAAGISIPLSVTNTYDQAGNNEIATTTGTQKLVVATTIAAPKLDTANHPNIPSGYAKVGSPLTGIDTKKDGTAAQHTNDYSTTVASGKAYTEVHTSSTTGINRSPAAPAGTVTEVELFAEPGPLTWTAKDLPAGLTLVPDENDTRFAYLQMTTADGFTAASSKAKLNDKGKYEAPYTITIENPYTSTKKTTLTGDLVVWDVPELTTTSLPALTVDKNWKQTFKATNTPTAFTLTPKTGAVVGLTGDQTSGFTVSSGKSKLKWNKDTLTLEGQLDRIPVLVAATTTSIAQNGFTLTVTPSNYAGNGTATDLTATVKGVAPKFENVGDITFSGNGTQAIKLAAGTPRETSAAQFTWTASIAAKDLDKLDPSTEHTADADIETTPLYGVQFSEGTNAASGQITYTKGNYAFKGLPITITVGNQETDATGKPTSKTFKVNVEGPDPKWGDPVATGLTFKDDEAKVLAGQAIPSITVTPTVTQPNSITVKPESKNGLTAAVDATTGVVTISGTPTGGKETKTAFTLTAMNTSTKQKDTKKLTITALTPPTITSTPEKMNKEVSYGKKVSVKGSAKGSKTIKWRIPTTSSTSEAYLKTTLGLELDAEKGTISGTPKALTLNSAGTEYEAKDVTLEAYNEALASYVGSGIDAWPTVEFKIGVKGAKTKITTKSINILKDTTDTSNLKIETNPEIKTSDATQKISLTTEELPDGFTLNSDTGALTVGTPEATKGTQVNFVINNGGFEGKGKVKFIVNDAKPEIETFSIEDMQAEEKAKVPQVVTVSVSDATCTGDTKIKWAIKKAPKRSQAKIKATKEDNGKTATLTITVPKNLKNKDDEDIDEKIVITATNTRTKEVGESTEVSYKITPVSTADTATAEDAKFDTVADKTSDATAEEKAATGEGEVKFGKTRTAPTAAQLGAVQKVLGDGYVIAAVLPEIEVTADGQYDFEVDLDEKVAAGAELVWFAFPESGKETEDDEIVDFYTKAGEDTKVVPEDHVLVVSPWLNAEVKYEPVIAVKVDAAEAEAVDAESVKEAAEEQAAE